MQNIGAFHRVSQLYFSQFQEIKSVTAKKWHHDDRPASLLATAVFSAA
jgi:hypothetical protein